MMKSILGNTAILLVAANMGLTGATAGEKPNDGEWLAARCKATRLSIPARQNSAGGHVTVMYDITAAGQVDNIRVVESDPPEIMDLQATNAVRGWRYYAYIKDGVESPRTDVLLTFTFGGDPTVREDSCLHTNLPVPDMAKAND